MEKLYRLKKQALPFFKPKFATSILKMATWENQAVYIDALEEVEPVYIEQGIKFSQHGSSLSGWSDDTTKLHFSISIHGTEMKYHDEIIKSLNVRGLMDEIQVIVNKFANATT